MREKEKVHFINPFRLISPRLDTDLGRLHELLGAPPADVSTLEEGLLVMCSKLIELSSTLYKSFLVADDEKFNRGKVLAEEVHDEEKSLTAHLVHLPSASPSVLKALILFPARLERVGDLLESVLSVSMIKAREGIPFSDRAMIELKQLFKVFKEMLSNLRDVLATCDRQLLDHMVSLHGQLAQMTLDFAYAHEDRLIEGTCSPRASSLYIDVLDSVRNANRHIRSITEALIKVASSEEMVRELRADR
jgi:phosphate:Na+ symporter